MVVYQVWRKSVNSVMDPIGVEFVMMPWIIMMLQLCAENYGRW